MPPPVYKIKKDSKGSKNKTDNQNGPAVIHFQDDKLNSKLIPRKTRKIKNGYKIVAKLG